MVKLSLYSFKVVTSYNKRFLRYVISYNIEEIINTTTLCVPFHINYPLITYRVKQDYNFLNYSGNTIYRPLSEGVIEEESICELDWLSTIGTYNNLVQIKLIRNNNFYGLRDLLEQIMINWNE